MHKKEFKHVYISERKAFDKLLRRYKRSYQLDEQQRLLDKYSERDSRSFWKLIGQIGVASDRGSGIPLEVDINGSVVTDRQVVLNK